MYTFEIFFMFWAFKQVCIKIFIRCLSEILTVKIIFCKTAKGFLIKNDCIYDITTFEQLWIKN